MTATDTFESLGSLAAGLGLFFIGLKLIGAHLRQVSGLGARRMLSAALGQRWRSGLLGAVAGALTQSTTVVTIVLYNLIGAGLITVRQALPMAVWCSVGTSALVLMATIDLRLGVLYLVGAIGTAYFFDVDQSPRYRHVVGAVLGAALLFLGLQFMKADEGPARQLDPLGSLLQAASGLQLFFTSLGLTLVMQSSAAVCAIAATLTLAGLLSLPGAALVILGANAGAALNGLMFLSRLKGSARQLGLVLVLTRLSATALMLVLWWAEQHSDWPLVLALAQAVSGHPPLQAAIVFLLAQGAGALLAWVAEGPLVALAARWAAPSTHELLARPRYISAAALPDPATALTLVDLEQRRLLGHLPYLLRADGRVLPASADTTLAARASADELAAADQQVSEQVSQFMNELGLGSPHRDTVDKLLQLQNRLRLVSDLRGTVRELDGCLQCMANAHDADRQFFADIGSSIAEAARFMLVTLHDATQSPTAQDLELLAALSADRSGTVDQLRKRWLSQINNTSPPMLETLFAATSVFERLVWIVRRFGSTLKPQDSAALSAGPLPAALS